MKRKEFIKGMGLAGLGLSLPGTKVTATASSTTAMVNDCVLIPRETAGPFPLDLTENQTFFRQDIREDEDGVQLNLKMKILGLDNCGPMPNVRVNIWHCTKDGVYSGYRTGNNPGDPDGTELRGYQFADANGEVEFITVFPGWYRGRICHIHFQVYVNSSYSAISQLTFPLEPKNQLYRDHASIYTEGEDPLTFNTDNVFRDGHELQLATLEKNETTGGYDSYIEVTVQGMGTTSTGHLERETAKVFELGQNFPNPYSDKTTIPLQLKQASQMKLELWDVSGKKVATVINKNMSVGVHQIEVNPSSLGLAAKNYVYQIEADNGEGIYRYAKMMTAL